MTDRQRFEENARNFGVKVLASSERSFTILSVNGKMTTTYNFDANGNIASVDTVMED